jgi:hypothetical protein
MPLNRQKARFHAATLTLNSGSQSGSDDLFQSAIDVHEPINSNGVVGVGGRSVVGVQDP